VVSFLRVTLNFDWVGGAFSQGGKKFAAQISLLLNYNFINFIRKISLISHKTITEQQSDLILLQLND